MKKPMKKVKRYSGEDGESEVIDMRDNKEGPTGIDDDVRARARRFLETGKKNEEMETPKPRARAKPKASEPSKPAGLNFKEEKARLEASDKPIERATPELDLLPIGKAVGAVGAGLLGARAIGKHILGKRAVETAVNIASKARAEKLAEGEEKYGRQIKSLAEQKSKKDAMMADKSERTRSSGAMEGDFKPSEIREGYKKGGAVKRSSASSRGDGIASRGHTRGTVVACGGGMMRGKK